MDDNKERRTTAPAPRQDRIRVFWQRAGWAMRGIVVEDDGMSTVEYAVGTIAAAAFGAILYTVVTGDSIVSALGGIIDKALRTSV